MPERDERDASLRAADERGDGQAAYELGNQFAQRGELDEALEAYNRADQRGHAAAAASVGVFAEENGHAKEAEQAYRRADERGDGFGAFRLGLLLSGRGDWDAANEAWTRSDQRGAAPDVDLVSLLQRRRGRETAAPQATAERSAFANPVLVGALTVLILMVAVFLAYNANQGLPFVPTRQLKVDLADGSNVVIGNDVREGGYRIGVVSDMKPIELANGQVGAQLTLQLDQSHGSVPLDSSASVLPRSVLGTKYVELTIGRSSQAFADGATMPLAQTSVPVQFDDVFKTFDPKTRTAIQQDLQGFGNTFAARGSALNDTIASLPQLLLHLRSVAGYLSQPSTQLTRLLNSLESFFGTVAPVAATQARLFTDMATTFAAISKDPNALESTIQQSPSTLDVATNSLQTQQPFLADLTTLGSELQPATVSLKQALPSINPAIEAGARTLGKTPPLNQRLQQVMVALKNLALAPGTNIALNALSATASTLNPMVRYLGPFQTVCNGWNYWWTYLSEHLSERTATGFAQRAQLNFADATQPNNVGQQGATAPAAGQAGGPEYYHSQNYGAAIDNAGNADCETGQRGYPRQLNHFDPQHRLTAVEPHTPGNQGPTFAGRTHVPAGETFSRNPTTGPQLPFNPTNP